MPEPLTISELTTHIRALLENEPLLANVWVRGEVSNIKTAVSGHWYFSLKDRSATLKCVMFRSNASRYTPPVNGDEIIARGRISVYDASGEYQLYVEGIRTAGLGDLYQQFEQLKAKLLSEGLFDESRKRPLPAFPRKIGVVTSPDAAAFQDVLNVLRRRFPLAQIILSACMVQGELAPRQIVTAIERLNSHTDVDVMLLIRGGGSIEDLWAFNNEAVARAVAGSRIPVVSGVGHETDFTLVDFASDYRAPTPSAAAEVTTPDLSEFRDALRSYRHLLIQSALNSTAERRAELESIQRTLVRSAPRIRIQNLRQRVDDISTRIISSQDRRIALFRERTTARTARLNAASPSTLLERGYALIYRVGDNLQMTSVQQAVPGTNIVVHMRDGTLQAVVKERDLNE